MERSREPGPPQHLSPWNRRDAVVSLLLCAAALALYTRTLAPSLLLGDGAEFQTLAVTLGLAHPTGYPIYLLVGKLFTLLPLGSLPYRVNLLSAACAALALTLLYLLARRLGCRPIPALIGPLGLGLGGLFWWHAVMAETYTSAMALIAGVLLLVAQWRHTGDRRYLGAAGLVGGLGLGVHAMTALCAPAILAYVLLTPQGRAAWPYAGVAAAAGALITLGALVALDGLDASVSFYNSTVRPWQARWDLDSGSLDTAAGRITFLVSARQFQGAMYREPLAEAVERAGLYWHYLRQEWGALPLLLMVVGATAHLARRSAGRATWREALLLLGIWATMLSFVLNYSVYDVYVFFLPTYVPLALLASLGAAAVCDAAAALVARAGGADRTSYLAGISGVLLALATAWPAADTVRESLAAGRITFLDGTSFARYPYPVEQPEGPLARAREVAGAIEGNALVYTDWGSVFTLYYVTHIEQGRTDVIVHEWFDPYDNTTVIAALTEYMDGQLARRPVYTNHVPPSIEGRYVFTPVPGVEWLFRVERR